MLPPQISRNEDEHLVIQTIAQGGDDCPVLMLKLNRYKADAGFPGTGLHQEYMAGLETFLPVVGGKLLWRMPVFGQAVGDQKIDEILAAWYPNHQAFLDLASAPGSESNYRLRGLCVEYAVIHRCPGDQSLLMP
jgi:hypothetical protein